MSGIHEECGVFGIYCRDGMNVVSAAYYALYALQHRGQESCGIAVNDDGVIRCVKNPGLVNDVITREAVETLGEGRMAVGHVRYGTSGADPRQNAQPLVVNHIKGYMALAHNGALTNARELREELELRGSIFHMTSDSEVISYVITRERLSSKSIEEAVSRSMDVLKGAYSMVVMSPRKLIAARDPFGFRPLCMGRIGENVVFASESCALDAIGATFERDIEPGEIVVVDEDGVRTDRTHVGVQPKRTCVFEYIYFARPDSVIDGSSVHTARVRAGSFLALEHPVQADVVIGVPDSGLDAAIGFSRQSGIPYGIGFIKNKYIGRTFIQPTQARSREQGAHQAQRRLLGGARQARGAGGRFHRARYDLGAHRQDAARGGGDRGAHALVRAGVYASLLLRHRHRQLRPAHRLPVSDGSDQGHHRRGLARIPERGQRGQARGQFPWLLHGLLRWKLSLRSAEEPGQVSV